MNLALASTALKNQNRDLSVNERAKIGCELAKQFEKLGEYEKAYEALIGFWPDRSESPDVQGLDEPTKAEVFLRCGALAGWYGGLNQIDAKQEVAKNLITRGLEIFEKLRRLDKVAEAQGDLALCYWREGSYDEARITLKNALNHLDKKQVELKAILLIRAGIVEVDSRQFSKAFYFYNRVAPLLERIEDDALKGSFHISFALLFRRLATTDSNGEHIDQALIEYAAASFHFEQAGNVRALARVENNLGYLFFTIGQFRDAHAHLDRARHLFLNLKDVGAAAQVDDTRARTLLAEGKLKDAERFARSAVKTLEKGDECSLLVEALTTYGTIMARLGNHSRSRNLLQRAIDVAETCGDLEGAGRARLAIIEELFNQTPAAELAVVFHDAADILQDTQDPSARKRLIVAGGKAIEALLAEVQKALVPETPASWQNFSLRREIKKIESRFIEQALRDAGGSVSKASRLLGFKHHQSLISLLGARHRDLQNRRSIKRKRNRHLISTPEGKRVKPITRAQRTALTVLHVEDHEPVARLVEEILAVEGIAVEMCNTGDEAWEILRRHDHYDALIVDNNLPSVSGLELVLRVRSTPHRRNLPIIMFSADDCEKEAWRAGVDAFLRKTRADELSSTIARVIDKRRKA